MLKALACRSTGWASRRTNLLLRVYDMSRARDATSSGRICLPAARSRSYSSVYTLKNYLESRSSRAALVRSLLWVAYRPLKRAFLSSRLEELVIPSSCRAASSVIIDLEDGLPSPAENPLARKVYAEILRLHERSGKSACGPEIWCRVSPIEREYAMRSVIADPLRSKSVYEAVAEQLVAGGTWVTQTEGGTLVARGSPALPAADHLLQDAALGVSTGKKLSDAVVGGGGMMEPVGSLAPSRLRAQHASMSSAAVAEYTATAASGAVGSERPTRSPLARAVVLGETEAGNGLPDSLDWDRWHSSEARADIESVMHPSLSGIIIPKLESSAQVEMYDDIISEAEEYAGMRRGSISTMVLIETAEGACKLPMLVDAMRERWSVQTDHPSGGRLRGLIAGYADLAGDMGVRETEPLRRSHGPSIALAAHALGVQAIDGVTTAAWDSAGYLRECRVARDLGFTGKCAIVPEQAMLANSAFEQSATERRWATEVVQATDAVEANSLADAAERMSTAERAAHEPLALSRRGSRRSKSYLQSHYHYVGPPHVRVARRILAEAAADAAYKAAYARHSPDQHQLYQQTDYLDEQLEDWMPVERADRHIGLDLGHSNRGDVFSSPSSFVVSAGALAVWDSLFFGASGPSVYATLAQALHGGSLSVPGSKEAADAPHTADSRTAPGSMLMSLCITLAIPVVTHHALLHLGGFDFRVHGPVRDGDELGLRVRVDGVYTSKSGGNVVADTVHELVRLPRGGVASPHELPDDCVVASMVKRTLFDHTTATAAKFAAGEMKSAPARPVAIEERRDSWQSAAQYAGSLALSSAGERAPAMNAEDAMEELQRAQAAAGYAGRLAPSLRPGRGVAHTVTKLFNEADVHMLSNLLRTTNEHHANSVKFEGTELVVPGPCVHSSMAQAAKFELGVAVAETWHTCLNLNRVAPGDHLAFVTLVKDTYGLVPAAMLHGGGDSRWADVGDEMAALWPEVAPLLRGLDLHGDVAGVKDGTGTGTEGQSVPLQRVRCVTYALRNIDASELSGALPGATGAAAVMVPASAPLRFPRELAEFDESWSARRVESVCSRVAPALSRRIVAAIDWSLLRVQHDVYV